MGCPWQECFDESTGYPYYWNVNTNAVTWEMPQEYKIALSGNLIDVSQQSNQIRPNIPVPAPSNKFLPTSSRNPIGLQKVLPNFTRDLKKTVAAPPRRPHRKSSESEDEKIELITSFGEESESDEENSILTKSQVKRNQLPLPVTKPNTVDIPKVPYGSTTIYRIQPEPQVIKPQKVETIELLDYNLRPPPPQQADIQALVNKFHRQNEIKKNDDIITDDSIILNQLRKQAQILQELGGEVSQDVEKLIKPIKSSSSSPTQPPQIDEIIAQIEKEQPPDLQKKEHLTSSCSKPLISLVAGYGDEDSDDDDDDDGDDKTSEVSAEDEHIPVKSIFPIIVSDTSSPLMGNFMETQIETDAKIMEDLKESIELSENQNAAIVIEPVVEEFDTKVFKRKRRIALDVLPTKIKKADHPSNFGSDSISRIGFGFQQTPAAAATTTTAECTTTIVTSNCTTVSVTSSSTTIITPSSSASFITVTSASSELSKYKNGGISFVKAETINLSKENQEMEKCIENNDEKVNTTERLGDMAALLREKVQFLEEGKDSVSPVQVMLIKLDTLLEAREKNGVTNQYLYGWLKETNTELSKLEQEAAPTGWCCQWDRLNKRYFYRNQQTGHIQWEYPADTDIVGGAEAMDICTTPPPPEDDVPESIPSSTAQPQPPLPLTRQQQQPPPLPPRPITVTPPPPKSPLEVQSPKTPPPPQIREKSPSPPPPPRISAFDNDLELNSVSSPGGGDGRTTQPLPPGIDSPSEVSFTVPDLSKNGLHKNISDSNCLGSELESFYSDIASLDATNSINVTEVVVHETNVVNNIGVESRPPPVAVIQDVIKSTQEVKKKRKKTKLGSGLTLKKKEVSLLVEKWKKVQNDF